MSPFFLQESSSLFTIETLFVQHNDAFVVYPVAFLFFACAKKGLFRKFRKQNVIVLFYEHELRDVLSVKPSMFAICLVIPVQKITFVCTPMMDTEEKKT